MHIPVYLHLPIVIILGLAGETATSPSSQAPEVGSIKVTILERVTYTIQDTVHKTKRPLNNGQITIVRGSDSPQTTTADKNGYYIVGSLLPVPYKVTATVPGYKPERRTVTVKKFESIKIEITLTKLSSR